MSILKKIFGRRRKKVAIYRLRENTYNASCCYFDDNILMWWYLVDGIWQQHNDQPNSDWIETAYNTELRNNEHPQVDFAAAASSSIEDTSHVLNDKVETNTITEVSHTNEVDNSTIHSLDTHTSTSYSSHDYSSHHDSSTSSSYDSGSSYDSSGGYDSGGSCDCGGGGCD